MKNQSVTLNRNLRASWLVEALRLRANEVEGRDAMQQLNDLISKEIQGAESRRKSLRYLRQLWLEAHTKLGSLQSEACAIYREDPQEPMARSLSFFMLLAVYPFAREVAETCGQLFRLQGTMKTEQIKRKVAARHGDRESVLRSTRYAVSIFSDLGLLAPTAERGSYTVGKPAINEERIAPYALEAIFRSIGRQQISRTDLDVQAALFAYDSHALVAAAVSDPRFALSRESYSRELVSLN